MSLATPRQDEREQQRMAAIRHTLERAYSAVPFYRDRFRACGVTPSDFLTLEALDRLPPTTKADIRQHFPHAMLAEDVSLPTLLETPRFSIASTSGTTGDRLQVLFDHTAGHLPAFVLTMWNMEPSTPLRHGGIFTSPICAGFECHLEQREYSQRIRGTTLTFNTTDDFFNAPDSVIRNIHEEMTRFQVHGMFVNSWYAAWWIHRAQQLGLSIPSQSVILPAYQYPTLAQRRWMAEAFSAPVFSNYGSTDLGGPQAGLECYLGRLHIREDKVWVDITRHGKRVAPGELGDVSITSLSNPWMPLIRYEVGDVGRRIDSPCECAVGDEWLTFELHGRKADVLTSTVGEPLTTRLIDDCLGASAPTFYSLIQEGANRYAFDYLDLNATSQSENIERLTHRLGPAAQLKTRSVRHFSPEKSMKYRQTGARGKLPFTWSGQTS